VIPVKGEPERVGRKRVMHIAAALAAGQIKFDDLTEAEQAELTLIALGVASTGLALRSYRQRADDLKRDIESRPLPGVSERELRSLAAELDSLRTALALAVIEGERGNSWWPVDGWMGTLHGYLLSDEWDKGW
jgi:hypothetical protein